MEKDTIITLEDNTEYALLDESAIDDKKYFFAVKLDKTTGNPTTEYEVFEEEHDGDDIYMSALEESDYKQAILIDFTNNYMNMVKEMMDEDKAE